MAVNVNVSQLLARRVELLAELANLNAAIEAASTKVHEVETHKNIRNTYPLTVNPKSSGVMVFADVALTRPVREGSHSGYVSGEDAAYLQANNFVNDNLRLKAVK